MTEAEFDARMEETEETRRYWQSELARLRELRDNRDKVQAGLDYATGLLTTLQGELPKIDLPPDESNKLPEQERNKILKMRQTSSARRWRPSAPPSKGSAGCARCWPGKKSPPRRSPSPGAAPTSSAPPPRPAGRGTTTSCVAKSGSSSARPRQTSSWSMPAPIPIQRSRLTSPSARLSWSGGRGLP